MTSADASSACPPPTSCPTRLVAPGHGVYAGWAHGYPAAINVGVRPHFETGRGLLVEPYLIGFDGDLYGETLRIAFVERMRGEQRFESVEDLVEQMKADVSGRRICAGIAAAKRVVRSLEQMLHSKVSVAGCVMAPELA